MKYGPLHDPIHVYVPTSPDDDPRLVEDPPAGIIVHRGPPLHPDDQRIVNGIPCTSLPGSSLTAKLTIWQK